ncbi:hypothetical protein B0H14DRAFT_2577084 [Mycena olivaceomarginata]|nr:hypothetical protein B0H14DRAFT_2577084 [Mycena olivaceomarginata]
MDLFQALSGLGLCVCRALDSGHEVLNSLHRASGGGRGGGSRRHLAENGFELPQPPVEELVKEKAAARAEKQARIDVYVQKWMEDMANLTAAMATEMQLICTTPLKVLRQQEVRKAGESKSVVELHQDYFRRVQCDDGYREDEYVWVNALVLRVFFCVVRNNISFKMEPEWYFMSKELENYMEIATRK